MSGLELLEAIGQGENQDWEFKSAKGGVPASIYETYSAMANTQGGVIVLGVEEKDGIFFIHEGVADPKKARKSLWDTLNNRGKVSVNLLQEKDVLALSINEKTVIVVSVPKADRRRRPVYVGMNPLEGTYRRNYEGDYLCSREEVGRMLADQSEETPDRRLLPEFGLADVDGESLRQYRNRVASRSSDLAWLSEDDRGFLSKLGGWHVDRRTGREGLTVAGLLMFGKEEVIRDSDAVPGFHVDYREKLSDDSDIRWDHRIYPDGLWNANLFQFYQRIVVRAVRDLPVPFRLKNLERVDDPPSHKAVREALVNALIHADYFGKGGIVILRRRHGFEFSNPGTLLVSFEQLLRGGVSECRNKALQLMFQMMGSGDKAGTGIDTILKSVRSESWQSPTIEESSRPDRVIFMIPTVSMFPADTVRTLEAMCGRTRWAALSHHDKEALVVAATEGNVSHRQLRLLSGQHPADLTKTLQRLVAQGFLIADGHGRGTIYRLREGGTSTKTEEDSTKTEEDSTKIAPSEVEEAARSDVSVEQLRFRHFPQGFPKKVSVNIMRDAIAELCHGRFLTLAQLASILNRNVHGLRYEYITPMVHEGLLETLYLHPNHPEQAYRTAEKETGEG